MIHVDKYLTSRPSGPELWCLAQYAALVVVFAVAIALAVARLAALLTG